MNKKILIVGYSSFIKRRVLKPLKEINNLDIYICSKSQKINEKVKYSFNNYKIAITKQNYDFIYISLINKLHFKYAKFALMRGNNLIIDKPITTSFNETQKLIKLAKKKNVF
jgi:predicted dehydrogenase